MEEKNLVEKNCILLDQDVHSFKEVIQLTLATTAST
jgi:PTS system galactitol-specific IIA component